MIESSAEVRETVVQDPPHQVGISALAGRRTMAKRWGRVSKTSALIVEV
jgi:hypothetical protein